MVSDKTFYSFYNNFNGSICSASVRKRFAFSMRNIMSEVRSSLVNPITESPPFLRSYRMV